MRSAPRSGWACLVRQIAAMLVAGAALTAAGSAAADGGPPPVRLSLLYKLDVMGDASGGAQRGARVLDDLMVNFDVTPGWSGGSAHASILNNFGGQPNELAGTLQGVNNIEVAHPRLKLYEAWLDQSFAGGLVDVRAGLYDTNSEFDVTDSAAIFLAPTYGISTEVAASGPNGPSIFPSTALAIRVNVQPRADVYLRLAAVNAEASAFGDPGGVNVRFEDGLLVWGEAGWTGVGKVALGAWGYTRPQPDIRTGPPRRSPSQGVYLLVDQPIYAANSGGLKASAFLRLGVTDGQTTPFRAAGAVGATASHLFASRPDAVVAIGYSWGLLSTPYRANGADAGGPLGEAESALELTYADKVASHLLLQPDFQYVFRPAGASRLKDATVLGLRATVDY